MSEAQPAGGVPANGPTPVLELDGLDRLGSRKVR